MRKYVQPHAVRSNQSLPGPQAVWGEEDCSLSSESVVGAHGMHAKMQCDGNPRSRQGSQSKKYSDLFTSSSMPALRAKHVTQQLLEAHIVPLWWVRTTHQQGIMSRFTRTHSGQSKGFSPSPRRSSHSLSSCCRASSFTPHRMQLSPQVVHEDVEHVGALEGRRDEQCPCALRPTD